MLSLFFLQRPGLGNFQEILWMLVAADTESNARNTAAEKCGREGPEAWRDPKTSCEVFGTASPERFKKPCIILQYRFSSREALMLAGA